MLLQLAALNGDLVITRVRSAFGDRDRRTIVRVSPGEKYCTYLNVLALRPEDSAPLPATRRLCCRHVKARWGD